MSEQAELTKDEKTWAMACHLSALCMFVVPFGNIIAPLVIWLIKKDESKFIEHSGKEAMNFQISMTIYWIISFLLVFVLIGFLLIFVVLITNIVFIIVAAVKTNSGEWYQYPITIRFIK